MTDKDLAPHSRRISILLAIQRALLGAIGPSLRGVTVGWSENEIEVRCLFHGALLDADQDAMNEVETHLWGDFPENSIRFSLEVYDEPLRLEDRALKAWAYCRREPAE